MEVMGVFGCQGDMESWWVSKGGDGDVRGMCKGEVLVTILG